MVHETKDLKKLAVIGLLYKIGQPDAFLSKVQTAKNFELRFLFPFLIYYMEIF
jgi:hypothetical protein